MNKIFNLFQLIPFLVWNVRYLTPKSMQQNKNIIAKYTYNNLESDLKHSCFYFVVKVFSSYDLKIKDKEV